MGASKRKKVVIDYFNTLGIKKIEDMGYGDYPVCMAKTQYSLSDDMKKLGRPTGFTINIREVYISAGAGFVVAITGNIMTMPGLSKSPAAFGIDLTDDGKTTDLITLFSRKRFVLTSLITYPSMSEEQSKFSRVLTSKSINFANL